jgi:hypothetical protein
MPQKPDTVRHGFRHAIKNILNFCGAFFLCVAFLAAGTGDSGAGFVSGLIAGAFFYVAGQIKSEWKWKGGVDLYE